MSQPLSQMPFIGQVLTTSFRSSFEHMPWYAGKGEIREYLKELNKGTKAGHTLHAFWSVTNLH